MRLRSKISFVFIALVLLSTFAVTFIAVLDIYSGGQADIKAYRQNETEKIKCDLKNFVDIAFDATKANYENAENPEYLEKFYGHRLKSIVDIAFSLLSEKEKMSKSGKLSLEESRAQALATVRNIRFNNSGYLWINSVELPYPKMIMHPGKPELEGKILNAPEFNCALGKKQNLFQAAVELCAKNGDGYIDYIWDKPTENGFKPDVRKLSYVKLFKPWNWVIGVGIYVDEAIDDAKMNSKRELENMRCNDGAGYLFILDTDVKGLMHPYKKGIEGRVLSEDKDVEGKKLFVEMADTCRKNGSGFVEYRWPKPLPNGGEIPNAKKLTYVRLFEPWGWVIGSGVYIDQIETDIARRELSINQRINTLIMKVVSGALVVILLAVIVSFLSAASVSAPIGKLVSAMRKVDITDLSGAKVELSGSTEIRDLGAIFNSMTDSLHESVTQLKNTTAAKEKIESELNVARDIQMSIIPKLFPAFPDRPEFDIFAILKTAKAVGGDLYDFFFIDDDRLCFIIGDVSGKGVPASLFMAVTRTLLRAKASPKLSAGEILTQINASLCAENDACMFVTFLLGILDLKTGLVHYSNAGHNLPYIVRNQMSLESSTDLHGPPLGVIEDNSYDTSEVQLERGDTIVLYTDGVTEAFDEEGQMYGDQRLHDLLDKDKMQSPKGFTVTILDDVERFAGEAEQADDITIVTLAYRG